MNKYIERKSNCYVYADKIVIHWMRTECCDSAWCGECGPDVLFTEDMKDVTCAACKRGMHRTREYRQQNKKSKRK